MNIEIKQDKKGYYFIGGWEKNRVDFTPEQSVLIDKEGGVGEYDFDVDGSYVPGYGPSNGYYGPEPGMPSYHEDIECGYWISEDERLELDSDQCYLIEDDLQEELDR